MAPDSRVRIGIIGAGSFANTHMEQFSLLDNVEVVAFMRRNPDGLREMQQRWGVPHGFTDHREMLKLDGLDAVDIITPTNTHRQFALDAIAAGKHVFCDKPLAMTAADCRDMLNAAENAGVIHSTNFNQRGNTSVGSMKRFIDDGFVGRIFHVGIWWGMSHQADARPETLAWRLSPESGGGSVYELIHVFDMCRFLNGEIARMVSLLNTAMTTRPVLDLEEELEIKVPDSSAFLLEFVNGGYAVVHTSFVSRGTDPDGRTSPRVEVSGESGRIVTDGRHGLKGNTGPNGPVVQIETGPPYPQPYGRFADAVLANDQSLVETSFYDGMKAAELVDAAFESWRTRSWIDLSH